MSDDETRRPVYVVWSGGMDSTLVLLDAIAEATEHRVDLPPWPNPNTVTVVTEHLGAKKIEMEHKSRERFLLSRRNSVGRVIELGVKFPLPRNVHGDFDIPQSGQLTVWVATVTLALPARCEVRFGHILGDTSCSSIPQVKDCMERLHALYHGDKSDLVVSFPLEEAGTNKKEVVRKLREYGVDPGSLWTCEGPGVSLCNEDGTPCGKCPPCVAYLDALAAIEAEDRRLQERLDRTSGEPVTVDPDQGIVADAEPILRKFADEVPDFNKGNPVVEGEKMAMERPKEKSAEEAVREWIERDLRLALEVSPDGVVESFR